MVTSGDKSFLIELWDEDGRFQLRTERQELSADLVRLGNNRYSLIAAGRSHEFGVAVSGGVYTLYLGSRSRDFVVEEFEIARLKKQAGVSAHAASVSLNAPMPGLITQVHCHPGDEITRGQPLLVMEAMKMENDIRSPQTGRVRAVAAIVGKSVDKGQLLVEFES
jgi:acetyl/propionyl-CoA carboxylase alpha subunit